MNEKEAQEKIVRAMAREGKSIRHIARVLGMGRKRVRKALGPAAPTPRSAAGRKKASKLDRFRERIRELAERTDRVGRKELRLTVKSIFQRLRREGYPGGITILGDCVREIRGSRRSRKAFARYEPPPAQEAQMDWSPYRVELGGKKTKIHIFSLILSYSRYQYLEVFTDERQDALLQGHVEAFHYFHGIPAVILYDNQTPVVTCRVAGRPLLHPRFEALAGHYGFRPQICLPYDKERKGRVERPFGYLETSFFPGRSFASLADFRRQLREWREGKVDGTGNFRVHGTTRRRPVEMWAQERDLLIELPPVDFLPTRVVERLVAKDCMVSVLGNRYTVPPKYVGRKVTALITPREVKLFDRRRHLVAAHRVPEGKGRMVIDEAHYRELRRVRRHVPASALETSFLALFPDRQDFLRGLKTRVKSIYPIHLQQLRRLREHFTGGQLADAMRRAAEHGVFTATYVEEILKRDHPAQIGFRRFDEELEKPRGFRLGELELGDAEAYDNIFPQPENENQEEKE